MKKAKRSYDMTARAAKAEATKARIRACAVGLFCNRPAEEFTLDEVARQAETTVQTVLRIFGSKDELIYQALEDMAAGGVFLRPTAPGDINGAVRSFFDIYETVGDLVIDRLGEERRRPALKTTLDQGRENHRDGVKTVFAPQLERMHGAERAQLAHDADRGDRRLCVEAIAARHEDETVRRGSNDRQDDPKRS
jgi:AcrR family transcriptional regulator